MVYEKNAAYKNGKFEGVVLPKNLAPYTFYFVPKFDDENKLEIAQNIYKKCEEQNISVLFDDRKELSIGAKIKDSKIVGCPYLVVFGKSLDEGFLEVENNKTG